MNNIKSKSVEAIILGMNITGLHVARNLGRSNILVIGIDFDSKQVGFKSRYCNKKIVVADKDQLLKFLYFNNRHSDHKQVLFPTSDEFVLFISEHSNVLKKNYLFSNPCDNIIETINNKARIYKLFSAYHIAHPKIFSDKTSLNDNLDLIKFPCIFKPVGFRSLQKLGKKAIKIDTREMYKQVALKLLRLNIDCITQELLNLKAQYSAYAYIDRNSNIKATYFTEKLHQNPDFGIGTLVQTCNDISVKNYGNIILDFLKKIKYQGLCEIEYAYDLNDNEFKVIEINTRPWVQNSLPTKAGINFAQIAYSDLLGHPIDVYKDNKMCIKWVDIISDFKNFCVKKDVLFNRKTIFQWIKSVRGNRIEAYYSTDDPMPFVFHVNQLVRYFFKKKNYNE